MNELNDEFFDLLDKLPLSALEDLLIALINVDFGGKEIFYTPDEIGIDIDVIRCIKYVDYNISLVYKFTDGRIHLIGYNKDGLITGDLQTRSVQFMRFYKLENTELTRKRLNLLWKREKI